MSTVVSTVYIRLLHLHDVLYLDIVNVRFRYSCVDFIFLSVAKYFKMQMRNISNARQNSLRTPEAQTELWSLVSHNTVLQATV